MTKYCENPECGEEFDPTEHDEEFCSPGCEDRVRELEDED
jgi:hypothetical protein